jgi:hypothetical protein
VRLWSLQLASHPKMAVDAVLIRDEITYRDKVVSSLTTAIAMGMPGTPNEAVWRRAVERKTT